MDELLLQSYDYLLPKDLIATQPITPKENAKLLVYERSKKHIIHTTFTNFEDFLPKDTLLVFNDTKVIPARIYGRKFVKGVRRGQGGAKIQALFHKQLE
ncbi:MAG: S-adenosylmethionine:tRNA ribosyltransferase-isomerase, partial [Helicobacter sp.]|nr:S-adenosylmethionine:tRNA ribosyltransferase-isomerase [Helicobacter sp.]